ncbi:MAG: 4-aminobutyrate--2-oxoglutarate transaminase [Parvularcula sp.]|nr:4-aminobutyrate--2-oxoglutarate transaminase [Parvularcula sp.]
MNAIESMNKQAVLTNTELQKRKDAAIARGEANLAPIYVARAKNAELWDVEGNRYIDFGSGIAVCNTGHAHPKIVDAVKRQVELFSHTCVMVTPYEPAVALAERLNKLAPGASDKKSMFVTTGAEAVENAVKIARAHTGRRAVIAFDGGYHGRTNFTLGLTGKNAPYKTLFGPFPGDIYRAPFPIDYHGVSVEQSLKALRNLFNFDVAVDDVAAIIFEPVQGEGGFYPAPAAFVQELRKICDEHNIVLIADEIQTGFGRTGKMFCMEHFDVEPDLMTVAKGLAGGFPLAGVVGKAEIMDAPLPGGLGGTYAGSPVGCAAALSVLDVIEQEGLVARAAEVGGVIKKKFQALKKQHETRIGDIRADHGAMAAMEFVEDGDASKPDPALLASVVARAQESGLVVLKCGVRGNVLRLLPPLTIEDSVLEEGLGILERSIEASV